MVICPSILLLPVYKLPAVPSRVTALIPTGAAVVHLRVVVQLELPIDISQELGVAVRESGAPAVTVTKVVLISEPPALRQVRVYVLLANKTAVLVLCPPSEKATAPIP